MYCEQRSVSGWKFNTVCSHLCGLSYTHFFCLSHPHNSITHLFFVFVCYRKGLHDEILQIWRSKTKIMLYKFTSTTVSSTLPAPVGINLLICVAVKKRLFILFKHDVCSVFGCCSLWWQHDLLCIIKTQWNGKAVQLKKRGSSAVDYWWTLIQMCAP